MSIRRSIGGALVRDRGQPRVAEGRRARRVREALALWVDDADTAELDFHVRLPRGVREALRRSLADRERAESARAAAGLSTARAARTLLEELHVSVCDAGELLGLSHQRVQQLARR